MEQESQKRKLDETGYEPSNASILCANNCGFFGSSTTNNLCSKCYKDFLLGQSKDLVGDSVVVALHEKAIEVDEQNVVVKEPEEGSSSGNHEKRLANRCSFCKKRVGLTGFKCKCDQTFCSLHRYSDKHNCIFDYKGAAQDAIAKANPVVKADKIEKI